MEIVEIELASGLEFVKVVKEGERERCAWLPNGCRKPVNVEKLAARRDVRFAAVTVLDADALHARHVEDSKLKGAGWYRARSPIMAKLVGDTEVE